MSFQMEHTIKRRASVLSTDLANESMMLYRFHPSTGVTVIFFRNAVKIFFDRLKNLCGCECARGTMEELEDREANVCTPTDLIVARLRAARATVHRACLSNKTLKTRARGAVRRADKIDSSSATRYNETRVSRLFLFFAVFDGSRFNSHGKIPRAV